MEEIDYGAVLTNRKEKHKSERRRSSIFSLLKRQKNLLRQASEPAPFYQRNGSRKFSVDSAILSDFQKINPQLINGYALSSCDIVGDFNELNGNGHDDELAGAASDSDSADGNMAPRPLTREDVLATYEEKYEEDQDTEIGLAGELVEEVAEENKSLLWFLLKQVRPGMDLSKVVLPTFILEPRSFLDKLADSYYHADILSETSNLEDPYLRFKGVLRWYLSGLYRKPKGLKKPYNPVLGELFRCSWKHRSGAVTYYVAEQVSHHPPVSAFYVSNRKDGFVIEGSLLARSKFYGNSTSAILEGCARVHLLRWGETYVTTAPYAHCKGIVVGTLSMELGGKVHILCPDTGYQADVDFKLRSFLGGSEQTNSISGRIKRGKDTVATIEGYWDARIDIKEKQSGEESTLLDVGILKQHRLNRYLVKEAQQTPTESQRLWARVSAAIRNEDQIAATEEKTIIEEGQRTRARSQLSPWVPRIFYKDQNVIAPNGIAEQGWRYHHKNVSPWQAEEIIEYEDDFVIKSLTKGGGGSLDRIRSSLEQKQALHAERSDSDSREDTARRSKSTRTIKQSLLAIDTALREQAAAIEKLSKNVETLNENQRTVSMTRHSMSGDTSAYPWQILGGFIVAIILQAIVNWLFPSK